MKNKLKSLFVLTLSLILLCSALAACGSENGKDGESSSDEQSTLAQLAPESESSKDGEDETDAALEDFDYANADLSKYITLPENAHKNNTVTLSSSYIISDDEVDAQIADSLFQNKQKTNGDTHVTDQPIKLGDSAFIYYTGYLDGVAFSGGSNASDEKPYELSIGSGSFIPGFEEGLIGVVPNETSKDSPFDLHVTFPENYGAADLAGKSVIFKVTVEYTVQYTIPKFNDDYVKNILMEDMSAEQYRNDLKYAKVKNEALSAIVSKLREDAEILEYPEQSVDYYYDLYIQQYEYYMWYYSMYGYSFESLDDFVPVYIGLGEGEDWREVTRGFAKDVVANTLIYYLVAERESISVSSDEVNEYAENIAQSNTANGQAMTAEDVIEQYGEGVLRQDLLLGKIDEYLVDNCTVEYKDE